MILLPTTGGLGLGNRWVFKPCLRFGLETESREWRFKGKEGEEKAWEGTLMEKGTAGPRPEGMSLGVQWLRPHTPDAGALVRSLVRELGPTGRTWDLVGCNWRALTPQLGSSVAPQKVGEERKAKSVASEWSARRGKRSAGRGAVQSVQPGGCRGACVEPRGLGHRPDSLRPRPAAGCWDLLPQPCALPAK